MKRSVRACISTRHEKLASHTGPPTTPRLIITQGCVAALRACLETEIRKGHEGISYLAGRSEGMMTLAIAAMRPEATTTRSSFTVSALAMARIVRAVVGQGLQVVGQVHTHPGEAYHSAGDDDGARIAYSGYVSIVVPSYGRGLPAFEAVVAFMFRAPHGFVQIDPSNLTIVPDRLG